MHYKIRMKYWCSIMRELLSGFKIFREIVFWGLCNVGFLCWFLFLLCFLFINGITLLYFGFNNINGLFLIVK